MVLTSIGLVNAQATSDQSSNNGGRMIDDENPHEQFKAAKKAKSCNMTPFILMIALSVHSCFEGLACGLSMNLTATLNIILAIVIHKSAAASSLGISLVKSFPNDFRLVRWLVFTFSIATPLGVALGMAL